MKKFYSLIFSMVVFAAATNAQCTINPSAQTTPGATPTAANLPCVQQGVAYNQTVQGQVQSSKDTTIASIASVHIVVDSVRMDSVTGLPAGITWSKSPNVLLGGGNGCVNFSGTTNDAVGQYDLTAWGTVWFTAHVTSPITLDTPYVYTGQLNQFSPFGNYYLKVCSSSSTNDINESLNAALSVYPNPNNGNFEVRFNGGSRVVGEMKIVDITGRTVFTKLLDVVGFYTTDVNLTNLPKGLYTLQVRTSEGFAAKNISIE
jgi:hypothetical protein